MDLFLNIVSGIVVGFIILTVLYIAGKSFVDDVFEFNKFGKFTYFIVCVLTGTFLFAIIGAICIGIWSAFVRVFSLLP
jgi:hypothetical protein